MALNVPVAMMMSMAVAFMVTPWLSYRILKGHAGHGAEAPPPPIEETRSYRVYAALLDPFLRHGGRRITSYNVCYTKLLRRGREKGRDTPCKLSSVKASGPSC